MRLTVGLSAALVVLTASTSEASPIVVDQAHEVMQGAVNFYVLAQTFTVGLDGNLVGIDVATFTDGPTEVLILGTSAGVPDFGNQLAYVLLGALPAGAPSGFQPTIFFSPVPVATGDVLALAVLSNLAGGGGTSNWNTDFFNNYAEGGAFRSIGGSPLNGFQPLTGWDLNFRTYVDIGSTTIPEPTTMALLFVGLTAAAGRRLRATSSSRFRRRS